MEKREAFYRWKFKAQSTVFSNYRKNKLILTVLKTLRRNAVKNPYLRKIETMRLNMVKRIAARKHR